jgi:hypothetical protein
MVNSLHRLGKDLSSTLNPLYALRTQIADKRDSARKARSENGRIDIHANILTPPTAPP